jgi:hypothetical protein
VPAKYEEEFNAWYNEEHIPERLSIPGVLSAARYQAVAGGPKYLACYELANPEAWHSEAWQKWLKNPYRRIYPAALPEEAAQADMAPVLLVGRMSVPDVLDAKFNEAYNNERLPLCSRIPGYIRARRFAAVMGSPKYTTVHEMNFSFPGVIMTGWLSDRIGRELSAIITYGTSIFGVACALLIQGPDQHLLFWLHACFFGLTWGARGPSITAKTADLFPGSRLGTILGAITIGTGVGSAGGSWLAGWSFDLTGSYHLAFWLSIFFYSCGSVAFWLLREPAVIR